MRGRKRAAAPPRSIRASNWRLVQADSIFIGVIQASSTFLPVFLLRLGANPGEIGLLTAVPALAGLALAIPFGRMLQGRRNIVPWYSRLRLLAWSSYAVMAAIAAVLPREQAISAILVVWALASLPSTAALVAFPIVMDGAAGRDGRFELLGRRWAIAGVTGAIAVVLGGQFLSAIPFPLNFELLLVIVSLAGFGSFLQSHRIEIPDQPRQPVVDRPPRRERLAGLFRLIASNRPFTRFELRSLIYTASIGLSLPILPLFYVHEVSAPDAWIGVIGSAASAGSVLGYLVGRQLARRGGGARPLLPALLTAAAGPAALSVIGWLPAVAAIAFVTGVAGAAAQLALFDQLMARIPAEQGVTFSSVDQTIQNLGIVIAPNVAGIIVVAFGIRWALVCVALVGLAAFVLFALDARATPAAGRVPSTSLHSEPTPAEAGNGA